MFFIHRNQLELARTMSALTDAIAALRTAIDANTAAANAVVAYVAADKDAPASITAAVAAVEASTKVMTDLVAPPA